MKNYIILSELKPSVNLSSKNDNNEIELEKTIDDTSFELLEKNIINFSEKVINMDYLIEDKEFKIISERLAADCISILFSTRNDYIDNIYKIIKALYRHYNNLYIQTNNSLARLYLGKFSSIIDVYSIKKMQLTFDDVVNKNRDIENIIWNTFMNGSYYLNSDINETIQKSLNLLEYNEIIEVLKNNTFEIKLSKKCKRMLLLNKRKYGIRFYYFKIHNKNKVNYNINYLEENHNTAFSENGHFKFLFEVKDYE